MFSPRLCGFSFARSDTHSAWNSECGTAKMSSSTSQTPIRNQRRLSERSNILLLTIIKVISAYLQSEALRWDITCTTAYFGWWSLWLAAFFHIDPPHFHLLFVPSLEKYKLVARVRAHLIGKKDLVLWSFSEAEIQSSCFVWSFCPSGVIMEKKKKILPA